MSQIIYVVDAFTPKPFAGNPAGVCLLKGPADEAWMRAVAGEMNLSETAFLYPIEGGYHLRWMTPAAEVKLCGHATLATAHTLWATDVLPPEELARFKTLSGWLTCRRDGAWIEMDFPATPVTACAVPPGLADALGVVPRCIGTNGTDYLAEVVDEAVLRGLQPNFGVLARLTVRGLIVTCQGAAPFDFLSRFFAPAVGVNEDPVTGSAHCSLGPYWEAKLSKSEFTARQASSRGGVLKVKMRADRVLISGQAVTVSKVEMFH